MASISLICTSTSFDIPFQKLHFLSKNQFMNFYNVVSIFQTNVIYTFILKLPKTFTSYSVLLEIRFAFPICFKKKTKNIANWLFWYWCCLTIEMPANVLRSKTWVYGVKGALKRCVRCVNVKIILRSEKTILASVRMQRWQINKCYYNLLPLLAHTFENLFEGILILFVFINTTSN